MGRASAKHAHQAPRVGDHDVIPTSLDEGGDSTDDEMPPLEPLEGAAQLGEVWLCGHGRFLKTGAIPKLAGAAARGDAAGARAARRTAGGRGDARRAAPRRRAAGRGADRLNAA